MESFIGGLISAVFWLALAAVVGAGWLVYKFCKYVLMPFLDWLFEACVEGGRKLAAWWREVTWERRMIKAHDEAVREIDAVRREHVAQTYALVEVLEEMEQVRTADETAAVRLAVRSAVRQD